MIRAVGQAVFLFAFIIAIKNYSGVDGISYEASGLFVYAAFLW